MSLQSETSLRYYLENHRRCDPSLSPFVVSLTRGFLPRVEPPTCLPPEFATVDSILRRMPILTAQGQPGLLATGELGMTVMKELPDLTTAVEEYRADPVVIGTLYRDYSFLASAYLLEPCHCRHARGEPYGLGRDVLLSVIARPLVCAAEIAGFAPFMEYAGSYALYNYRMADPSRGFDFSNLRLIRAFEHGVASEKSSEAGFILIHVAMVAHSGALVKGVINALDAIVNDDVELFRRSMIDAVAAMENVNSIMDRMWSKSKPKDYVGFRTFIFGIKNQSMFPKGVVYDGVSDVPMDFRGESGANDSLIPLCDNVLQIIMPETPLTEILKDFRGYRPPAHRVFLQWVKDQAEIVHFKDYALREPGSAALYLRLLDQVREFRWRHWCFAREYILKQTSHPTATGGSPIVTWLPNQLQTVLNSMLDIGNRFSDEHEQLCLPGCDAIIQKARQQCQDLVKEVGKYRKDRSV